MLGERRPLAKCLCVALVALVAARVEAWDVATGQSIPKDQAREWVRWVIPRPREVLLDRKVAVPVNQVAITASPEAGLLEQRVAEEKPWRETIDAEIDRIRALTHKPILLGLFIHDYGKTGKAVPMNILELQSRKAAQLTRSGKIEGFVILQSGWFHHEDHRGEVQWLRQYLDGMGMAQ